MKKTKSKTKKIIIGCCIAAAALVIIISSIINRRANITDNPEDLVGNTAGNLYNGGLFCEDDEGYVYFANAYDNDTLYRMHPDETDLKKLSHTQVKSLNVDKNHIYYYQGGSSGGEGLGFLISTTGVFSINKHNTKSISCIERVLGDYIVLAGNNLYYTSLGEENILRKYDLKAQKSETLLDISVLPASVENSTFYYINNKDNLHLMSLNLKTGVSKQALPDDIYMPIVDHNTVFGIDVHDNYALIKVDLISGQKTTLDNSERVDMLNVSDNYIYYQTSGSSPRLKRILRDGSGMEIVADGVYRDISLTSEYAYFTSFSATTPVYKCPLNGPVSVTTFDAASRAAAEAAGKGKK